MAVHVVTLGWDHPSRVLPSIMKQGDVDRVEFVCAEKLDDADKEVASKIAVFLREKLREVGIEAGIHRVNPFDSRDVFRKLIEVEEANAGSDICLNITGGTKITVVATMMYAMTSDAVKTVYYASAEGYNSPLDKGTITPEKIAKMPKDAFLSWGFRENHLVPRIRERELFEDHEDPGTAVLMALRDEEFGSTKELVEAALERTPVQSPTTVRMRLRDLEREGLVEFSREKREMIPRLTVVGSELADLIHIRLEHKPAKLRSANARKH